MARSLTASCGEPAAVLVLLGGAALVACGPGRPLLLLLAPEGLVPVTVHHCSQQSDNQQKLGHKAVAATLNAFRKVAWNLLSMTMQQ